MLHVVAVDKFELAGVKNIVAKVSPFTMKGLASINWLDDNRRREVDLGWELRKFFQQVITICAHKLIDLFSGLVRRI